MNLGASAYVPHASAPHFTDAVVRLADKMIKALETLFHHSKNLGQRYILVTSWRVLPKQIQPSRFLLSDR